jgi:hypothetical protein
VAQKIALLLHFFKLHKVNNHPKVEKIAQSGHPGIIHKNIYSMRLKHGGRKFSDI